MIFLVIIIIAIAFYIYLSHGKCSELAHSKQPPTVNQPHRFDLLDDNGDSIDAHKMKIVIDGGDSDAPIQELQYFCIKDKGYHVTVWPKDYNHYDMVRFNIAGIEYRDNIDEYLGESVGVLEAEPTNHYDPNAIKILAHDDHHVGYVPKDMTAEVRKVANLPCPCFFYIGKRNGIYFSDCYITKN